MKTNTLESPAAAVRYPVANCATQIDQLRRWARVAGCYEQIDKALASLGLEGRDRVGFSISLTLGSEKETLDTLIRMFIALMGHFRVPLYPFTTRSAYKIPDVPDNVLRVMESQFSPYTAKLRQVTITPILEGNGMVDIGRWTAARKFEGYGVSVFSGIWSYFLGWVCQLEKGQGVEGPMKNVSLILPFIGKSGPDGTFKPVSVCPKFGESEGNALLFLPVSQAHHTVSLDQHGVPKFPHPCIACYTVD